MKEYINDAQKIADLEKLLKTKANARTYQVLSRKITIAKAALDAATATFIKPDQTTDTSIEE